MMPTSMRTARRRSEAWPSVLVWLLGCTLWTGCAAQRFEALDLDALPTMAAYPDDGEIMLFDETVVRYDLVDGAPVADYSRHLRYRVLTAAGILDGAYGDSKTVGYEPGAIDLLDFEARVLSPAHARCADDDAPHHCEGIDPAVGRIYGRGDADESSHLSKGIETDAMTLSFRISDLQVGSVVDIFHRQRYRDEHLRGHHIRMAGREPNLVNRIVLDMPADWTVEAVARQQGRKLSDWSPVVSTHDGRRRETWLLTDVPPVLHEPYDVDLWNNAPTLFFRLRTWRDPDGTLHDLIPDRDAIGAFFAREIRARSLDEITDPLRARAEEIVAGAVTPTEKARRLHDWVRWRVRHTVVEAELGGLLPNRAADVLERRHGRRADIALLLRTMLAAVGIESHLVYLYRHSLLRRWPDPAAILRGADGIGVQVALPSGPMWAFPSDRTVPFGRIPARLQFARAIRCADPGEDFELEGDPAQRGTRHVELDLEVRPDGAVEGTFRGQAAGLFADIARERFSGAGRRSQRRRMPGFLDFDGEVHRITRLDGLDATDPDAPVVTAGEFTLAERIEPSEGGVWAVHPADILADNIPHLPPGPRASPLVYGNPRQFAEVIRLTVPRGWRVEVPPDQRLASAYGSYSIAYRVEGPVLVVERDTLMPRTEFHASEYADYAAYWAAARGLESRPVLLHRSTP